jgi:hypothetical protein
MTQRPVEFVIPVELGGPVEAQVGGAPDKVMLGMPYVAQTASNWCWATCAAMLARFTLNKPLNICQAASTLIPGGNCCAGAPAEGTFNNSWNNPVCNRTCTVSEVQQLHGMLGMQSTHAGTAISFDQIHNAIAGSRKPVEVAFSWFGGGGHVVVAQGVDRQTQSVNINDPWPDTGAIVVTYEKLLSAYGLGSWFDAWTEIKAVGS